MKKVLFFSGVTMAALALVAAVGLIKPALADGNKYSFIARGVITDVDEADRTMKMDIIKVDGKGKNDMEGENIEFVTDKARVVKVVAGKDKSATWHTFAAGQEVGIKGVAKGDDTFVLSFARIEDRSFQVVGLLQSMDKDAKTVKISVISSTYKPKNYKKGDEINMVYTDDTTFRNTSTAISIGDVNADAQKVKVVGTIKDKNTWEVKTLWDKYKGK